MASHAHQARNWNRDHTYKAVGFTQYRPIDAFELDDMDGSYLTDSSFFRQNLEYLATLQGDAPVFNLDRPAFRRHPGAIIHGNHRGVYGQQQAVHGRVPQ